MNTLQGSCAPCQPAVSSVEDIEEATANVCESCERIFDDCECVTCPACDARFASSNICATCRECTDECCDCYCCNGCDERRDEARSPRCYECENCDACCDCLFCEGCDARHRSEGASWCEECDRCTETCNCESESTPVEFFHNPLHFHHARPSAFARTKSRRFISCELEVAEIDRDEQTSDAVRRWCGSIVHDGSLPNTGFEINTAPANGDAFINQIEDISAALRDDGARVTHACGLHVHIDARDFTYWDVRRLVLLYAEIETALFAMMPLARRASHYCQPCGQLYACAVREHALPKLYKSKLIKSVYGEAASRPARRDKYSAARYHALNLHSWFYRGTVECRLHTGTINARKIICWSKLWASLLDAAMHFTERDITKRILNHTPDAPDTSDAPLMRLLELAPDAETRDYIAERHAKHNPSPSAFDITRKEAA